MLSRNPGDVQLRLKKRLPIFGDQLLRQRLAAHTRFLPLQRHFASAAGGELPKIAPAAGALENVARMPARHAISSTRLPACCRPPAPSDVLRSWRRESPLRWGFRPP